MELWTDNNNTEFAIFLHSNPVIKTGDKVEFTKKIAQASYFYKYKKNWERIIDKWIIFYFSNKYSQELVPSINTDSRQEVPLKFNSSRRPPERRRPKIKCNFCGLKYRSNNERKEHELIWHLKMDQKQ